MHDFTRDMISLREYYPVLSKEQFYRADELVWFDTNGRYPDWSAADRSIGCHILSADEHKEQLCLIFNAEAHAIGFQLPNTNEWRLVADTTAGSSNVNLTVSDS